MLEDAYFFVVLSYRRLVGKVIYRGVFVSDIMRLYDYSLDTLVLRHLTKAVLAVAVELEQVIVILPERLSVAHRDQSDVLLLHVGVKVTLDVHTHRTRALVENGVEWLVVDESGHGHALLFTAGEHVSPVVIRVPTISLTGDNMRKAHILHDLVQIVIGDASALDICHGVRVDNLVAERAVGQVRSLWDVENLLNRWLSQGAALGRPELAKDSEEGGFAAAVWSRDQEVHARLDLEVHLGDELVTVRAIDRDVLEDDVIREHNICTLS